MGDQLDLILMIALLTEMGKSPHVATEAKCLQLFKIDHTKHQKVMICGDWGPFSCPNLYLIFMNIDRDRLTGLNQDFRVLKEK